MSSNVQLDPFVAQAQNDDVAPLQKIEGTYYHHSGKRTMRTLAYILVDLNKIIQGAQTGMLTTRASDGHLHSRAMTPAYREARLSVSYDIEPSSHDPSVSYHTAKTGSEPPNALTNLVFIANNSSPKFQEIQNDNHVNLSFFHTSSMHWASISGVARVTEDRSVVKKYWSSRYATVTRSTPFRPLD